MNLTDASHPSYYEFQLFNEDVYEIEIYRLQGQHLIIEETPFPIIGTAMHTTQVKITLNGFDFSPIGCKINSF